MFHKLSLEYENNGTGAKDNPGVLILYHSALRGIKNNPPDRLSIQSGGTVIVGGIGLNPFPVRTSTGIP